MRPSSFNILWGSCCWYCKAMGCKKKKIYIDVSLSDMVLNYNTYMGGVDLTDILIQNETNG